MKKFFLFFIFLAIVLIAYPFFNKSENMAVMTGLPWQIDVLPDGSTQVYGLHIGVSRLSDVLSTLGEDDVDLAIIATKDEVGSLEMYYRHYQAGVISGKLVVQTTASEKNIMHWRENAASSDYMASGKAKKYRLSEESLKSALNEVVTGLTFIPSINLDEALIKLRFGKPEQRVELDGAVHFLYPSKGLDILVFDKAKDIIQYTLPNNSYSIDMKKEK